MHHKKIISSIVAGVVMLGSSIPAFAASEKPAAANPNILLDAPGVKSMQHAGIVDRLQAKGLTVTEQEESGRPKFLMGALSAPLKTEEAVLSYLALNENVFGIDQPARQLSLVSKSLDSSQGTHYLYQQQYKGIPVYGKYLRVSTGGDQTIQAIANQLDAELEGLKLNTQPSIGKEEAINALKDSVEQQLGYSIQLGNSLGGQQIPLPEAKLVVYPHQGVTYLAYEADMVYVDPAPGGWVGFVDAHTGEVIHKYSKVHNAGPATSVSKGFRGDEKELNIYQLPSGKYILSDGDEGIVPKFPKTKGEIRTLKFISFPTENSIEFADFESSSPVFTGTDVSHAVDAHYNARVVFDFYKNILNRNSLDGEGMSVVSFANVTNPDGSPMENAFWLDGANAMFYGSGAEGACYACALDVVAHELTHGVISHTAGLIYENQPGALNESFADIMAMVIDRDDWELGEDIKLGGNNSLRDFVNPNRYNQPKHMSQYFYLNDTVNGDWGGVHINSGIPNHAAYLTATGIDALEIDGLDGREVLGWLTYDVITNRLTPVSEFEDARDAYVAAVSSWGTRKELPHHIVDQVRSIVIGAWAAVGLSYEEEPGQKTGNAITYFTIPALENNLFEDLTEIDHLNNTVIYRVPGDTDITKLTPAIAISTGSAISPAPETEQDFTEPVVYTVTAENGQGRQWKVFVVKNQDQHRPVFESSVVSFDNKTVTLHFDEYILNQLFKVGVLDGLTTQIRMLQMGPEGWYEVDFRQYGTASITDGKLIVSLFEPLALQSAIGVNPQAIRDVTGNDNNEIVTVQILPAPEAASAPAPTIAQTLESPADSGLYMQGFPNALISIYNSESKEIVQSIASDESGLVYFSSLPEGRYFAKQAVSLGQGLYDSLAGEVFEVGEGTEEPTSPSKVTNLRALETGESSFKLGWDASAATGYEVVVYHQEEGVVEASVVPVPDTTYTVTNVKPGKSYLVTVTATASSGAKSEASTLMVTTQAVEDQQPPIWSPVNYVALGDSLAAGVTPFKAIDESYPSMIADQLHEAGVLHGYNRNFPVPGYTTADVLKDIRDNARGGMIELPTNRVIRDVIADADLITISAGANDVLKLGLNASEQDLMKALADVSTNMGFILKEIKELKPNAEVYVMGYYNPYPSLEGVLKLKAEAIVNALNAALQGAAAAEGAVFVPVHEVIASGGMDYLPNPNDVHLSGEGYQAIADQFWNLIEPSLPQKAALAVSEITSSSVVLGWTPAEDNVAVHGYKLYLNNEEISSVPGDVTSYKVTGLAASTAYTFKVEAFDAAGNVTVKGPAASATTIDASETPDTEAPVWPDNKSLSVTDVTYSSVQLTWTLAHDNRAVTGYKVYKDNKEVASVQGSVYSYQVTGLNSSTRYTFRVEAGDASGNWTENAGPEATARTSNRPGRNNSNDQSVSGESSAALFHLEDVPTGIKLLEGAYTVQVTTQQGKTVTKLIVIERELAEAFKRLAAKPAGAHTLTIQSEVNGEFTVDLPSEEILAGLKSVQDASLYIETPQLSSTMNLAVLSNQLADSVKNNGEALLRIQASALPALTAVQLENKAVEAGASFTSIPYSLAAGIVVDGNYNVLKQLDLTWKLPAAKDLSQAVVVSYDLANDRFTILPNKIAYRSGSPALDISADAQTMLAVLVIDKRFVDIIGHWAEADIQLLASRLLINGMSENTFAPDSPITRAQFITLIVRALGLPEQTEGPVSFTDVRSTDWFAGSVYAGANAGLIQGYEDLTFKPNDYITRAEMVVIFVRSMKLTGQASLTTVNVEEVLQAFRDHSLIGEWARVAVAQMVELEVVQGMSDGRFASSDNATRAQAAVMLKRLLTQLNQLN